MDCQDYITEPTERKKGQHLQREERGAIQHLKRQGYSCWSMEFRITKFRRNMESAEQHFTIGNNGC